VFNLLRSGCFLLAVYSESEQENTINNEITSSITTDEEELTVISKKFSTKKVIISICIIFVVFGLVFGGYEYTKIMNFKNYVNKANEELNLKNYDEAISFYNKALSYKKDKDIEEKLVSVQNNKQYQDIYDTGLKLLDDKKYTEAIQKFSEINQNMSEIYTDAQNKIEECRKNIINDDIQAANDAIKNEDYDAANKYIEDILKIDASNNDAKLLKTIISIKPF